MKQSNTKPSAAGTYKAPVCKKLSGRCAQSLLTTSKGLNANFDPFVENSNYDDTYFN